MIILSKIVYTDFFTLTLKCNSPAKMKFLYMYRTHRIFSHTMYHKNNAQWIAINRNLKKKLGKWHEDHWHKKILKKLSIVKEQMVCSYIIRLWRNFGHLTMHVHPGASKVMSRTGEAKLLPSVAMATIYLTNSLHLQHEITDWVLSGRPLITDIHKF